MSTASAAKMYLIGKLSRLAPDRAIDSELVID
jgi:hypothetical protein